MTNLIAAYPAAPGDPEAADRYYDHVAASAPADTLGLAWRGDTPLPDLIHRVERLPADWRIAITTVPGSFKAWNADHRHGLASPEAEGRQSAIELARQVARAAVELAQKHGRPVVSHVELLSAPGWNDRTYSPDPAALATSLEEVVGFDWAGAVVTLEHCDAYIPGQAPAKGFLSLPDEINVLSKLDGAVGLSLNWGRSVIEARDPAGALTHIALGRESGLLRLFTFSGAADAPSLLGPAWADSHLALATGEFGDPASLLTPERVVETLTAIGPDLPLGSKVAWPAAQSDPILRARAVVANHRTIIEIAAGLFAGTETKATP
jgi:hypothetical protein